MQDKITINLSAKNQYDKAYKSIVPVTGITAVQAARRTHHQFTKSLQQNVISIKITMLTSQHKAEAS